ncbi:AAA family ATPase [Micrococcus sp. APC 4021]|uniref:AAA family ATPase n=1 Tax=Micrococcus TaxID=1269 RepID=UPI001E2B4183|nr:MULTISPECIES: AAA family ATPase [Micrococcus]MCD0181465.1 AAA family ATPase [Micrococcus luteus]MCV7478602.1 ATP-binding protein [Micrococcus luteus]MCV7488320.1 ATP-binding protein [Micrococcus luteus]MDN3467473.1 AAA family ATPase [Micrococcus sp. APC 4021]
MRLSRFRVRKFRNIIDTGEIDVDEAVTCLVGMNESGKTAVLSALHRLNPIDGESFDEQRDYPRWLLSKDRREGVISDASPISAAFELEPADRELLEAAVGAGVFTANEITVSRKYNTDATTWDIPRDTKRAVQNLLSGLELRKKTSDQFKNVSDLDGIEAICAQLVADETDKQHEKTSDEIATIREAIAALPGKDVWAVAVAVLKSRLPKFFYFSDYSQLDGRIDINDLAEKDEQVGSSADQTARALLRLASTTPAAMASSDYEDRKSELEAVGHELTSQVFEYWKQNDNLQVEFDVDRKIKQINPQQHTIEKTYLDIRVKDTRHSFSNNFARRSSGFRWFFSFLAAFTEFESRKEPVVVLLDEPGLTLHARAQADFVRFINERLATAVQVLYTTHSPFMVETDRIDRVRIVEDGGPKTGATVTREALTVGEGSLFPLQAALGYDLAQHLFIGPSNLLVEGPSDYIYLDAISRALVDRGRTGLDDRWRVLPAGGASNIPAFVALMGRNLDVTVLVDSGTEGADRLQKAVDAARLERDRIIQVSEVTGRRHSDIEDLFEVEDYLSLYNEAFGTSVTAGDLGHGDRIVKRLTDLRGGSYDHYRPADVILRNPARLDGLSDATFDRFETLIKRINRSDH